MYIKVTKVLHVHRPMWQHVFSARGSAAEDHKSQDQQSQALKTQALEISALQIQALQNADSAPGSAGPPQKNLVQQ